MSYLNLLSGKEIVIEILRQEKCVWPNAADLISLKTGFSSRAFASGASIWKRFEGTDGKNPIENVAFVNKANIREKIICEIKNELFRQNLPYIHLSHAPSGFRNICLFRIDCDETDKDSFLKLAELSASHNFKFTWFVDVKSQKGYLNEIAAIRRDGHDIQLHCYEHKTYRSYSENLNNIKKGKDLLERSGIPVEGFASPFGKWNSQLNRVIEELGMEYSSEFSAGYDDLPFFPPLVTRMSHVLQIPVHPVCIGSLRNAGFSGEEMISYFDRIIGFKYQRNSPLIFYGHTKYEINRYPEVLGFVLDKLNDYKDVWHTTMTEYSLWWKLRLNCEYRVEFGDDLISIVTKNTDKTISMHIENSDSSETDIPLIAGKYRLSNMKWRQSEIIRSSPSSEMGKIYLKDLRVKIWDLRHGK